MDPNQTTTQPAEVIPEASVPQVAPVPQGESSGESSPPSRKKIFLIAGGVFLALIFLICLVIILLPSNSGKKPTNPQKQSAEPNILLVSVGDKNIYKNDVLRNARQQYLASAVDGEVLQKMLNIMIEREILDQEALRLGFTLTDAELKKKFNVASDSSELAQKNILTNRKYDYYKQKIMETQIESRAAIVIGYSTPPNNYSVANDDERKTIEQQRTDGAKALNDVEQRIAFDNPLTIAREINQKYPVLQPIMAVNGYIVDKAVGDPDELTKPRIYVYSTRNKGQRVYDTIFAMNSAGDVRKSIAPEGQGGSVIALKYINNAAVKSYDEWLSGKKGELLTIHNTL